MQTEPLLYEAYVKPGKVVQIYRYWPIDALHPNARAAAAAAFCAGEQDAKLFWEMHDWLFENQSAWASAKDAADKFRQQAVAFGANDAAYATCVADSKTAQRVQQDVDAGSAQGVRGTPAFFLYKMQAGKEVGSPTPILGMLPFAQFSQRIDALLK